MTLDELIDQLCDFRNSFGGSMSVKLKTTYMDFETAKEFTETYPATDSRVRTTDGIRYLEISSDD